MSAVIEEDTKKYLKNFEDEVTKVNKYVTDSIKDYQEHDKKLGEDLKTLGWYFGDINRYLIKLKYQRLSEAVRTYYKFHSID